MVLKVGIAVCVFGFLASFAFASTFENMEGTYKILSCNNESDSPSREDRDLCEYTQLTVHPSSYATVIYFSENKNSQFVRAFGLPKNMRDIPNGRYSESADTFASYTNTTRNSGEIFILRKTGPDLFHFSMHRRSSLSKTLDVFEIELRRVSRKSNPLPPPPPIDDEGDPCGEPDHD
ncbi:hypothetical protein [Bdellovibrio sp. HCB-162]|uniref:hypothetical protein n=1 Tax=Bdellovibrio sp. HCB-162 TaxID=3394234 RepID=UPI0039BC6196